MPDPNAPVPEFQRPPALNPLLRMITAVLAGYLWVCLRTSRVVWLRRPDDHGQGPVVFAFWHSRLWASVLLQPAHGTTRFLVSGHRDGRFIGAILRRHGIEPVVGTHRGGSRTALASLLDALRRGDSVAITPDGPVGPSRVARRGATHLAGLAGVALMPCAASARRAFVIPSWDRMLVPLPFGILYVAVGAPLAVSSPLALTLALNELQQEADAAAGRGGDRQARNQAE